MDEQVPAVDQQRRYLLVGAASAALAGTLSAPARAQNNGYRPVPPGKQGQQGRHRRSGRTRPYRRAAGARHGRRGRVFTTSANKVADARRFGASHVVVNYATDEIAKHRRSFDFILDTAPYQHDMNPLVPLLKRDATLCLVGIGRGNEPNQLLPFITVPGRNSFAGSLIGSIRETQEVIDFCADKGIKPSVTLIPIQSINGAWDDVVAKKARYRYVIDMRTLGA